MKLSQSLSVLLLLLASLAMGRDFDPTRADFVGKEALSKPGYKNFIDVERSPNRIAYMDYEFTAGTGELNVKRFDFTLSICGNEGKVTFDVLRLSDSSAPVLESRTSPTSNVDVKLPVRTGGPHLLRVWLYDFTCPGPSFEFSIE